MWPQSWPRPGKTRWRKKFVSKNITIAVHWYFTGRLKLLAFLYLFFILAGNRNGVPRIRNKTEIYLNSKLIFFYHSSKKSTPIAEKLNITGKRIPQFNLISPCRPLTLLYVKVLCLLCSVCTYIKTCVFLWIYFLFLLNFKNRRFNWIAIHLLFSRRYDYTFLLLSNWLRCPSWNLRVISILHYNTIAEHKILRLSPS